MNIQQKRDYHHGEQLRLRNNMELLTKVAVLEHLRKLVAHYPNDQDLGEQVRLLIRNQNK